jgi:hypothetical protein
VIDVAPVIRETKTLVIAGHNGKEMHELKKPYRFEEHNNRRVKVYKDYEYPTDKEIAQAEKELAAAKAAQQQLQDERAAQEAAERADPRYPYLRRFEGGSDFEPWRKLTLKQLKQIARILDSVRDDTE